MAGLPIDLDAIAAARRRLERALELVTVIQTAGIELEDLLADDTPLIGLNAAAADPPGSDSAASNEQAKPEHPPEPAPAETPAADPPPPPAPPNPPRAGGGRRPRRRSGVPPIFVRAPDALRELGGRGTYADVARVLGDVTAHGVEQAAIRGIPGVRRIPGQGGSVRRPGMLELEDLEDDHEHAFPANIDPSHVAEDREQRADEVLEYLGATPVDDDQADPDDPDPDPPAPAAGNGDTPHRSDTPRGARVTVPRFPDGPALRTRPDPPAVSARTRRALNAEQRAGTPDPPAVPLLEQNIRAALADGPNTIRGLDNRLPLAARSDVADTVMRLVATGALVTAGRDGPGGDMLYRLK